jgi:hypothetical protein
MFPGPELTVRAGKVPVRGPRSISTGGSVAGVAVSAGDSMAIGSSVRALDGAAVTGAMSVSEPAHAAANRTTAVRVAARLEPVRVREERIGGSCQEDSASGRSGAAWRQHSTTLHRSANVVGCEPRVEYADRSDQHERIHHQASGRRRCEMRCGAAADPDRCAAADLDRCADCSPSGPQSPTHAFPLSSASADSSSRIRKDPAITPHVCCRWSRLR